MLNIIKPAILRTGEIQEAAFLIARCLHARQRMLHAQQPAKQAPVILILMLTAEQQEHGAQIMQLITALNAGQWMLTAEQEPALTVIVI